MCAKNCGSANSVLTDFHIPTPAHVWVWKNVCMVQAGVGVFGDCSYFPALVERSRTGTIANDRKRSQTIPNLTANLPGFCLSCIDASHQGSFGNRSGIVPNPTS